MNNMNNIYIYIYILYLYYHYVLKKIGLMSCFPHICRGTIPMSVPKGRASFLSFCKASRLPQDPMQNVTRKGWIFTNQMG